jgi:hypothetical protein
LNPLRMGSAEGAHARYGSAACHGRSGRAMRRGLRIRFLSFRTMNLVRAVGRLLGRAGRQGVWKPRKAVLSPRNEHSWLMGAT